MTYRIRVRVHEVEVEYDVSAEPTSQDALAVLSAAADLHREIGRLSRDAAVGDDEGTPPGRRSSVSPINGDAGNFPVGTVDNIINKLSMTPTGPNMVLAAALHLTLEQGKSRFTRDELHNTMKKARDYKKTMTSNLTSSIRSVMKNQQLNETGSHEYSIASPYLRNAREQLAQ